MTPLWKLPDFAALTAEINSLAGAEGKIAARIAEIDSIIRDSGDAARELSMARINAGLHFAETGEVRGIANDPSKLSDERLALQEQRSSIRSAITERQEQLRAVEREASRSVCAGAAPHHRDIAARIVRCLEQLDSLWQEEVDLFHQITSGGYDTAFGEYLQWAVAGRIGGPDAISHYYRDMKRYGHETDKRGTQPQRTAKAGT